MRTVSGSQGLSRRAFLGGMAGLAAGVAMGAGRPTGAAADFTFLLCSDLHAQDVPQGERILRDILAAARGANADFIVQLGDFLRPDAAALRAIWEDKDPETGFAGGRYLAIGNHDLDSFSREAFCKAFIDTSDPHTPTADPYYSFDHKGVHFVFLDGNLTNTTFRLDDAQLAWLRHDLEAAQCRCLLFSHESIDHELANGREIQTLLGEVNRAAGWRKVVAAFSGHNHSNYDRSIGGIRYIQINSAAYVWIGKDTQAEKRHPPEVLARYSLMRKSIPYDRTLFAVVRVDAEGLHLTGTEGRFVAPTPQELGLTDPILSTNNCPLVPWIRDAEIPFRGQPPALA